MQRLSGCEFTLIILLTLFYMGGAESAHRVEIRG